MTAASTGITKGKVLKYALLPEIFPRLRDLFGSGFGWVAYLMAQVYYVVQILPANHPYLKPSNIGQFSMIQVIAEAANHIHPSWKRIDQIIMFIAILAGLVIMILQLFILAAIMLINPARAQDVPMPTDYAGFFTTPTPENDIAFRILDMVFGVPDIFDSQENVGTPLQVALQALFEFYSYGMLLVGFLVIIYFVITVVSETAQSGTPFGKRFNHVWAPIRLVIFFALLIPLSHGFNAGQLITLVSAKYGSGLATNGWLKFNEALEQSTYLGSQDSLIAEPNMPEISHIPYFMMLAKTCEWAEGRMYEREINAYIIEGENSSPMQNETVQDITARSTGGNIRIRFGEKDEDEYSQVSGNVFPYCGEIVIRTGDISEPGSAIVQQAYYDIVRCLWMGDGDSDTCTDYELNEHGRNYTLVYMPIPPTYTEDEINPPFPGALYKSLITDGIRSEIEEAVIEAIETEKNDDTGWQVDNEIKEYGWAGAGIWYNKVAQKNGALISSVFNTPAIEKYPAVMERIMKEKSQHSFFVTEEDRFSPALANGRLIEFDYTGQMDIALTLNQVHTYWLEGGSFDVPGGSFNGSGSSAGSAQANSSTGNLFVDVVNAVMGTEGLFEMCKNTDIHPLAQLSAVGKSMIDNSIQSMATAAATGAIGGLAKLLQGSSSNLSATASAFSSFFGTIGGVGILIGFILFYVVPFLPFIYFFFAVGGWIKSIFEAMVAIPLWALAHLRIDGEGLPGNSAMNGYFLLFEIFIRPILIIFGLIAGIAIFAALVKVLNDVFYLLIVNLSGHNPEGGATTCFTDVEAAGGDNSEFIRGPVDEFFFTIIYTIIVYMIGMACFKLIDLIPNNILRWVGGEVSSFNDNVEGAEGLVKYVTIGGGMLGSQLSRSVGSLAAAFR